MNQECSTGCRGIFGPLGADPPDDNPHVYRLEPTFCRPDGLAMAATHQSRETRVRGIAFSEAPAEWPLTQRPRRAMVVSLEGATNI
jgi:hypothetical protein